MEGEALSKCNIWKSLNYLGCRAVTSKKSWTSSRQCVWGRCDSGAQYLRCCTKTMIMIKVDIKKNPAYGHYLLFQFRYIKKTYSSWLYSKVGKFGWYGLSSLYENSGIKSYLCYHKITKIIVQSFTLSEIANLNVKQST